MRVLRLVVFLSLLALPLLVTPSAGALDLCEEECQPPNAEQNSPYEFQFVGEEGCLPYRFSYLGGTLPPGLETSSDGLLSGTPTEAGTFDFWVGLDDNSGPHNPFCLVPSTQSQAHFFLTVMPDLAVTTQSLPLGAPGRPYSARLEFSNPEAGWPVVWDVTQGSLPAGLSLSGDGVISGTPAGPDTKRFVVRAREPFRRSGERELTLTVAEALQARAALGPGEVGLSYAGSIPTAGGLAPFTWSAVGGSLPRGLTLDPATGSVRGLPREAGTFGITFAVADGAGQQATVPATLRIVARLAVRTTGLPLGTVGSRYRARLSATGGLGPRRWQVVRGKLPRGIRLDIRTGRLSGIPRRTGHHRITVQARDRLGARATKTLRLTVTRR